jgi:hypothetical protein
MSENRYNRIIRRIRELKQTYNDDGRINVSKIIATILSEELDTLEKELKKNNE